MKTFRSALAGMAIAGLLLAQPAAAASRAPAPTGESENLAGLPAAAAPALAVLAVFFLAAAVAVISDDDEDGAPVSP